MKKRWLAMLMAMIMAISPAAAQTVYAAYEIQTVTMSDASSYENVATVDVEDASEYVGKVYEKYVPDFTSGSQPIADDTYIIMGGRSGSNTDSVVTRTETVQADDYTALTYTTGISTTNGVVAQSLPDCEWEVVYQGNSDAGNALYTFKAPEEEKYLAIYNANATDGAVSAATSQSLVVMNNTAVSGTVTIGGASISDSSTSGYLNHRSNPGTWTGIDVGSAWFLYSDAYQVLTTAVETLTAQVGDEGLYTAETWTDYETALKDAKTAYETQTEAESAYVALAEAVEGLEKIELPEGITTTTVKEGYYLMQQTGSVELEEGTYMILSSRFYRALLAEQHNDGAFLDYAQVLTQPTSITADNIPDSPLTLDNAFANETLNWEITAGSSAGEYYITNVSTGKYLTIGDAQASTTETATATTIAIYGGSETHTGSVTLAQGGEYLNMYGGNTGYYGGDSNGSDGGAAHFLLKKEAASQTYNADTTALQELVDDYKAEDLVESNYSTESWEVYTEALTAAEALLAESNAFDTVDEAVAHKAELDAAYQALEEAKAGLGHLKYTLEELYAAICEANGGSFLYSEEVYSTETAIAYRDALKAARQSFSSEEEAKAALAALVEATKNLETVADSCFPEIQWSVTIDANRTTSGEESLTNYVQGLAYLNTSAQTEGSITFEAYEALTWEWINIQRLVDDEDEKTTPVWSQNETNGLWSRKFSSGADGGWTQADVYKISGVFEWPEGYDLQDTTIVLDSKNDFFYRDIYEYISESGLSDYFPIGQVIPINDDVYVVMWAEGEDGKPTIPGGTNNINDHFAFWSGTSGKGIWTENGKTDDDWSRTEPATYIEYNLQGERAFRDSYPNKVGTGAVKADGSAYTNSDVVAASADIQKYLDHTDGWYTMVDTTAINSVMRSCYDEIAKGTKVHIDLYVMNNSGEGMIDELEIELFKEKDTETEVIINYYLNEVTDDGFLGTETLLNQAYGTQITLLPGAGAGQLNSYKAEAIYQAGYKDVTDGVQLNELIVTEGGNNVINVLYTVKDSKIVYLNAASGTYEYNGSAYTLENVAVTENGFTGEATSVEGTEGSYTLPDGNIISNVHSYVSETNPGIYTNNFAAANGSSPEIAITDTAGNDITNTYTIVKIPGTLTITYAPSEVTRTYDFGTDHLYKNVLNEVELKATLTESAENVSFTDADVTYKPLAANTGETVKAELAFAGGYKVNKTFNFVPATNVLYEEEFLENTEDWTLTGTAGDVTVNDNESTVYGYTAVNAYANPGAAEFGNDAAYQVTLTLADGAITTRTQTAATFTFTGTGFDLISECGTDTGMLVVRVNDAEGKAVKAYVVDTYYSGEGYFTNASGILDYQVPVVRNLNLDYGTYTVNVFGYLINTAGAVSTYSRSASAVSQEDIVMAVLDDLEMYDLDTEDVEVSFIDENSVLNGGTGNITAAPAVSTFALMTTNANLLTASDDTENTGSSSANVYIDGFRVYKPLETDAEIYTVDNEADVKYESVYSYAVNSATEYAECVENAFVYVEYDGAAGVAEIAEYKTQGPQNEVYLTPGSGIAFALVGYEPGDLVQISAKSVGAVNAKAGNLAVSPTATEMYYTVTPNHSSELGYYIAITNDASSTGMLSLGNLKVSSHITAMASGAVGEKLVAKLESRDGDFVPQYLTASAKAYVTSGRNTSISIRTSTEDVKRVTISVNGGTEIDLTPANAKAVAAGRASVYKYSYTFSAKGQEKGTVNNFVVRAYDENGVASEPISIAIEVQ